MSDQGSIEIEDGAMPKKQCDTTPKTSWGPGYKKTQQGPPCVARENWPVINLPNCASQGAETSLYHLEVTNGVLKLTWLKLAASLEKCGSLGPGLLTLAHGLQA